MKDLSLRFNLGQKTTKHFIDLLKKSTGLINSHVLLLLTFSFVLLFVNNRLIYGCISQLALDPWYYLGYMLDLKQHLRIFQGTYYGSRLPWILFGASLFKIFGNYAAIYILRYSVLNIAMFSVYGIIKRVLDARTALVSALFTLFSFPIFISNQVFYIDGFVNSLLLLLLYFLLPIKFGEVKLWRIAFAGGIASCIIFTQFFLLIYLPIIVGFYLFFNKNSKKLVLNSVIAFCAGFFLVTVFFCVVHYIYTREFWFFLSSVNVVKGSMKASSPYWLPVDFWIFKATWLIFPFIVFIESLFSVVSNLIAGKLRNVNYGVGLQYMYIVAVSIFVFLEFIYREPVLYYWYYSSYLSPLMILSFACFFNRTMVSPNKKFYLFWLIILAVSQLLVASNVVIFPLFGLNLIIVSISLAFFGFMVSFFTKNSFKIIGVVCFLVVYTMISGKSWNADTSNSKQRESYYHALVNGITEVNKNNSKLKGLFWYSSTSLNGPLFAAIVSSNLWGYRLFSYDYPKMMNCTPKKGDVLITLTDDLADLNEINSTLKQNNLTCKCKLTKQVDNSDVKFNITFLDVFADK